MGNKVFVDGNLLVKSGIFYGHNIIIYADEKHRDIADEVISTDNGIFEINDDYGSMFNTYYVKGGITMYGENGSDVFFFLNEHARTYTKFNNMQNQIIQLLEKAIIPKELQSYFYQQQYISLFANLEYFLYNTFMWETCQCYDSYKRVCELFTSDLFNFKKTIKKIFRSEHNILQEITFINKTKDIVFHKIKQVNCLYKTAFNISANFEDLDDEIKIRHDLIHRAGYTKDDVQLQITKDNVLDLKDKISNLVNSITEQIKIFNRQNNILE